MKFKHLFFAFAGLCMMTSCGGGDIFDEIYDNSKLSQDDNRFILERCALDTDCLDDTSAMFKSMNAIGCGSEYRSTLENRLDEEALVDYAMCVVDQVNHYTSELEGTDLFKAVSLANARSSSCAVQWNSKTEETAFNAKQTSALAVIGVVINFKDCIDEYTAYYNCEGALSCKDPGSLLDDAMNAICVDSTAAIYAGGDFASAEACVAAQTTKCETEFRAAVACSGK